jgi:hypothetical protein
MIDFLKKNILIILIGVLLVIIFFQRCDRKNDVVTQIETKIDTVWSQHTQTITSKPIIIKSEPTVDTMYLPDPNYNVLKVQYEDLAKKFLVKNSYSDKILVDSIGYVQVDEIVTKNEILDRKLTYKLDYPVITKTITKTTPPKNQLYIGGALQGNPVKILNQINAGLLLKNKRDQIYGVYAGTDLNGQLHYGVQMYWKIKL